MRDRWIHTTIRLLKKDYGTLVHVYRATTYVLDKQTGQAQITYQITPIPKAILLPKVDARKFVYDISFIKANSSFIQGGFFDPNMRDVLVDMDELPVGFKFDLGHTILYNNQRYAIKDVENTEHGVSRVTMLAIQGSKPFELHLPIVDSDYAAYTEG